MATESYDRIEEKLDILVKLQALSMIKDFGTTKEKILFLGNAGLPPKVIADLLQTTPNHVNVTLSTGRRSKSKPTD